MNINATLINLYNICRRECWLHANDIRMEQNSDTVYDGKLLHESVYPQRNDQHRELALKAEWNGTTLSAKVDFYDALEQVIHETKRSDKVEKAHIWQLKYYIWLFQLSGVSKVTGLLEYPKLRQRTQVILSENDVLTFKKMIPELKNTIESEICPPSIHGRICRSCSYFDFCYAGE